MSNELLNDMFAQFLEDEKSGLPDDTIIRNSMQTPDGTEIVSRTRHDYVTYEDENGETYMVDGGTAYLRRSINEEEATDTTVMLHHGHDMVREAFQWGTRGEEGDEEVTYLLLKDMTESHMRNIINDGYNVAALMQAELDWRESAAKRKQVRLKDIERIQRLMEKRPDHAHKHVVRLEQIIEAFNSNEFN